MTINSFPINTIPPAANLIANTPAGIVTATDVQVAINQLASAIPSPGPGTDPLFLTLGLDVNVTTPTLGNPSDRHAINLNASFDCSNLHPDFTNATLMGLTVLGLHGQNASGGGVTNVKESFFATNTFGYYAASGQKFLHGNRLNAFGMGDSGIHAGDNVIYAGGPVNGDEGQCWGTVSFLQQQPQVTVYTITAKPTQSVVNTTVTQAITRSENAQTVTVASTAGAVNGDWVVIDQELPTAGINLEAVKIISFTGGGSPTITGVFRCNHLIGATVTPALVFTLSGTFGIGQDRVLINLTQASYSTGTVSSISGGGFIGTGTGWNSVSGIIGGNPKNIGAITLAADDYTLSPFDAGANRLRSWYQINGIVSNTSLGIFTTSVAGGGSYQGKGPGAGAYTIRACARVLRLVAVGQSFTGQMICETSTSTWNVGDSIEQVLCPYPDVTGFQWNLIAYTNGGTYRNFTTIRNNGPRAFSSCFLIDDVVSRGAQTDGVAFSTILDLQTTCNQAIAIGPNCTACAISLSTLDTTGAVCWGGNVTTGANLMVVSSNQALTLSTINGFTAPRGQLVFANAGAGINPETNQAMMQWHGYLQLVPDGSGNQMIQLDNVTGPVNFEHGFLRWKSSNLEIGTEKGGTGSARDMIVKTNGVEQMRFIAGDTVQFSGAPSFSANGSVATVLGSVGPAGAHTTVQEWLTVKNPAGVTRYIQCF
jgi:hypothetical protein